MPRLLSRLSITLAALTLLASAGAAQAAPLTTEARVSLQMKLIDYIDERTIDGKFLYFDADRKETTALYPAHLHPRIVPIDDIYFLCADFRDVDGKAIEVDFVARIVDGDARILQTMVGRRGVIRAMKRASRPWSRRADSRGGHGGCRLDFALPSYAAIRRILETTGRTVGRRGCRVHGADVSGSWPLMSPPQPDAMRSVVRAMAELLMRSDRFGARPSSPGPTPGCIDRGARANCLRPDVRQARHPFGGLFLVTGAGI